MTTNEHLGQRFEAERDHLRAVAYRMLGSATEADDAIQETWLRLNRSDAAAIENLSGWLTTVIARVCLDMLRSHKSRREESFESQPVAESVQGTDPEQEALLADSVGVALLVVLNSLTPPERLAFVMHDMFDVSFDEIGSIIGRSPQAARQLASRARRRVRGPDKVQHVDLKRQRKVVDAFLTALRAGDFEGLLAVLDPDVLVHVDMPGRPGAPTEIRGAANWAKGAVAFSRLVRAVQPALVNGSPGLVFAPGGRLTRVLSFKIVGERIVDVEVIAKSETLKQLNVSVLGE